MSPPGRLTSWLHDVGIHRDSIGRVGIKRLNTQCLLRELLRQSWEHQPRSSTFEISKSLLAAADRHPGDPCLYLVASPIAFAAGNDNRKSYQGNRYYLLLYLDLLHCSSLECSRQKRESSVKHDAMRPNSRPVSYSKLLRGVFTIEHSGHAATIPLHLCPAAARTCATLASARTRTKPVTAAPPSERLSKILRTRIVHSEATDPQHEVSARPVPIRPLPVQCYGCGAFSQTAVPNEAGYYNPERNAVKVYMGIKPKGDPRKNPRYQTQNDVVVASLHSLGNDKLAELGLDPSQLLAASPKTEGVEKGKLLDCISVTNSANRSQKVVQNLCVIDATIWFIITKANRSSTRP